MLSKNAAVDLKVNTLTKVISSPADCFRIATLIETNSLDVTKGNHADKEHRPLEHLRSRIRVSSIVFQVRQLVDGEYLQVSHVAQRVWIECSKMLVLHAPSRRNTCAELAHVLCRGLRIVCVRACGQFRASSWHARPLAWSWYPSIHLVPADFVIAIVVRFRAVGNGWRWRTT